MGKIRDIRFDTLKGFLILTVVFGHFFTHDASHGILSEAMANFIYSFHMPLFVFISGYFSNNHNVIRGGAKLLETYIVFQLIKGVAYHYSVWWLLFMPGPMLWYLIALIIWRFGYAAIDKLGIKVTWHLIAFLIFVAIVAGFVPRIGREFALSRTIVFAPYFFLGVMAKDMQIIDVLKKKLNWKLCVIILSISLVTGVLCAINSIDMRTTFSGTVPYPEEGTWCYAMARLVTYFTSAIFSMAFIRLFSFETNIFSKIGKDSLKYYMFHGLFLMAVEYLNFPWSTFFAIVYATVVSVLIFFFNKTKLSDFAISPVSFVIDKLKQK